MSPGHSSPLRHLVLLGAVGAVGVVACGENHPTAPSATPSIPATFALTANDSAAFLSAVEDIDLRILPTLGESERAVALRGALERVGDAVARRDESALMNAVAMGERALAGLGSTSDESAAHAADLDAVRLVLLEASAFPAPRSSGRDATR